MSREFMSSPMRCLGCGHVHDTGLVTVIARYADCSVWKCPKCNRTLDDRPGMGGTERIDHRVPVDGDDLALVGGRWVLDRFGVMRWEATA